VERRLSAGCGRFRLKKNIGKTGAAAQNIGGSMAWNVTVDADKCVGDNECVDVCPVEVYELQDGKAVPVNADECLGCESCVEVCESGAITVEEL
jgi:NAD-dependent dihydropyrimidine dehydrogenase PreA subunit